jgi:hypothetical protein
LQDVTLAKEDRALFRNPHFFSPRTLAWVVLSYYCDISAFSRNLVAGNGCQRSVDEDG